MKKHAGDVIRTSLTAILMLWPALMEFIMMDHGIGIVIVEGHSSMVNVNHHYAVTGKRNSRHSDDGDVLSLFSPENNINININRNNQRFETFRSSSLQERTALSSLLSSEHRHFDGSPLRDGGAELVDDDEDNDLQLSTDLHNNDDDIISTPLSLVLGGTKQKSAPLHLLKKTGTTIVGILADNGRAVVLAADTRATAGSLVADKRCEKIHKLADNIYCCGAGTSGDIDHVVRRVEHTFRLRHALDGGVGNMNGHINSKHGPADVAAVCKFVRSGVLFPAKGNVGANLVVGGWDYVADRAVLAALHPHGSMDAIDVPFTALGSGGPAAMSVLERDYHHRGDTMGMSLRDAVALAKAAVTAGVRNDLGSGSHVDICVIRRQHTNTGEGAEQEQVVVVEYERAVVKEESLDYDQEDVDTGKKLYRRHSKGEEKASHDDDGNTKSSEIMSGVNGFGTVPYRISSRTIILGNEETLEQERKQRIRRVLGLQETTTTTGAGEDK